MNTISIKEKNKIMENSFKHIYQINGMSCRGCAANVKNKLSNAAGVISVKIDLAKEEAEIISSQALNVNKLQESMNNTGYSISELKNPISL